MVETQIETDKNGVLKSALFSGHAGFSKKGSDIVCSAVSILAQTAYAAISSIPGVEVELTEEVGFYFKIKSYPSRFTGELRGITIYLSGGLELIRRDYKNYLDLKLKGESYGTS